MENQVKEAWSLKYLIHYPFISRNLTLVFPQVRAITIFSHQLPHLAIITGNTAPYVAVFEL